mmetsp:Transcript_25009/g.71921  ORF Transcript_25009/g.71921 Transcript_25009/m.71921 type:complete len:319 (-) Transcript_25009:1846-2802(-)
MEEEQAEQHFLELVGLIATLEPLGVEVHVSANECLLQPLRRLDRHLDAHLQDRDWELRRWACRKPQAEHFMQFVRIQLLDQALERSHEAWRQVAVLQQDPLPIDAPVLHTCNGLRPLSLSQADRVNVRQHIEALSELLDVSHRIAARRQDVDQGDGWGGVLVTYVELQWRGLQEEPRQLCLHDAHECLHCCIRSQCIHHERLLQGRALHLEVVRPLCLHRIVRIENRLPAREVRRELTNEPIEHIAQCLQHIDTLPTDICEPIRIWGLLFLERTRQAGQQRHNLVELQFLLGFLALQGEHDSIEQLVLFEEPTAHHDE